MANETAEPDGRWPIATRRFVFLERESGPTWSRSPLLSRLRFDPDPAQVQIGWTASVALAFRWPQRPCDCASPGDPSRSGRVRSTPARFARSMPRPPARAVRVKRRARPSRDAASASAVHATTTAPSCGRTAGTSADRPLASASRTAAVQAGRAGVRCSWRDAPCSSGLTDDVDGVDGQRSALEPGKPSGRRACGGSLASRDTAFTRSQLVAVAHAVWSSVPTRSVGLWIANARLVPVRCGPATRPACPPYYVVTQRVQS